MHAATTLAQVEWVRSQLVEAVRRIESGRSLTEVLSVLGAAASDAASGSEGGEEAERRASPPALRRVGEYWTLTYEGRACAVRDRRGLRYLAALLDRPDVSVSASDLHGLVPSSLASSPGGRATAEGDALGLSMGASSSQEVLDAKALREIRRASEELREEVDQARRRNDFGRVDRLEEELERLEVFLRSCLRRGGRTRLFATEDERRRKSVSAAIHRAIRAISVEHPALGAHLRESIRAEGFGFSYDPRPTLRREITER